MNSHHRAGKHIDDSSASWDLFSSGSEGEGYDETISASIHRDVDAWESAQARLSRSADVPRRAVRIDKGLSGSTYTGRPLARQRRSPAGTRPRDGTRAATVTSRTRDHAPTTGDRTVFVSCSNQREKASHSSSSRLHRSGRNSERDVMPRTNLKRSPATSTIPGAGTGAGASTKLNTLSILSSTQNVSTETTDSPPRQSQSVHFSKTDDNRKYKNKEIEIKVPSRAVIPTSTRSFIPGDQESFDESSSSSSSSSSEFKGKKTRTRAKGGSKGSSKTRSRAALPGSRGVHSINARKASSKPSPRKTVGRERRSTDTARYPSRKGSSDEASSSGGMSSTFSSTTSCTSTEESRDDGVVEAKEVTLTPSSEKLQRTTAVQTEESSASRPVCVSRASQTDVQKPAKRAVSRTAPSKRTGSSRTPAKISGVQSGKTTLEDADISTRDGTSGKVPFPTSSAEATRRRQQQGTAPSSPTTPSIERVSSIEPSTSVVSNDVHSSTGFVDRPESAGVVDSSEEVAALRCSSPAISGRPRFTKEVAHIEEGLLPPGQILVESPVANVPGGLKEDAAVSETPAPRFNSTSKTTGLYRSIEDVVGTSDEHRGHQSDVTPKVFIPPSMPTENSVKVHSLTRPTEDAKGLTPGPNSHSAPEWSVVPEQRGVC
ncbi:uncharacterized protein LOC142767348 [Rhipicephalus microplus]|uniref:uncharacterized protein LOC142767348 n=1 Tax=Rhipicephalus microplus TaxID=6941 RepID=UPI003F6D9505